MQSGRARSVVLPALSVDKIIEDLHAPFSLQLREREYLVSMRLRNQGPPGPDDDALDGLPAGGQELVAVPPDMVGLLI